MTSCSALSSAGLSVSTARTVQSHMNAPFDNLESLLLSISPVFCQRFQQCFISKCTTTASTKPSTSTTTTLSAPSTPASTVYTSSTTNSVSGASVTEGSGALRGVKITDEDHQRQQKKQDDDDFLIDQLLRKEQKASNDINNIIDTTMITNRENNKDGNSTTTAPAMDDISEWIHHS